MAEAWIATHQQEFDEGKSAYFAITLQAAGSLIGSIGLRVNRLHEKAELGYWIGKPYWGNGYCTEAAMAVEDYCFEQLRLNRVYAFCTVRNHASARVLVKIGMSSEGLLRQALHRWGSFEDLTVFSILRSERIRQES